MTAHAQSGPGHLYEGVDWSFHTLQSVYNAIEDIALGEFGLDVYTNQIEVISAEQMLDAYSSIGMPLMYSHWSFGKSFARNEMLYRKGHQGLAYEIVINSNPCISYVMEENSITMQALVIAHAAFGHNHFFKNNHLFRQWTDADTVLDFFQYAKQFTADCEERYGMAEVEAVLDAAHALQSHAVDRYPRKTLSEHERKERARARAEFETSSFNDLWRTLPDSTRRPEKDGGEPTGWLESLDLPESNIVYFLQHYAPRLSTWQRDLLDVTCRTAQYFYPQKQTKVMNEGCACYAHYHIMQRLHEKGLIPDSAMLEALHSHSQVIAQPDFDDQRFGGINPYALGFGMMQDIHRICMEPTDEDKAWFPDIAGNGDPLGTLKYAWENFRDESFILQYLSPHLIRDMHFFKLHDDTRKPVIRIDEIHDEHGYRDVRRTLAASYAINAMDLDIQVTEVDLDGDRTLTLTHTMKDGIPLETKEANIVLSHLAELWGYDVKLVSIDPETETIEQEFDI
ncbi:SpoVR family protein [Coralliovum pocilloporae]|uniref:SpoVR family protein n=1 Tax=Coralliovum pocilloporae TaxID=3066369 RepID=UPI003307B0AE